MSTSTDKLTAMFYGSIDQCNTIDDSTAQIETRIVEVESQRDAIQEAILDKAAIDMSSYLEIVKIPELGYTEYEAEVVFGVTYGITTVLDWKIIDSTTGGTIYEYGGVGWDDDSEILTIEDDFQFGYDYIHHTNGLSGTYGLQDQIDILYNGLNILIINKNKFGDSRNIFQKYMS